MRAAEKFFKREAFSPASKETPPSLNSSTSSRFLSRATTMTPFWKRLHFSIWGRESLARGRFDEALDESQAAYDTAKTIGAGVVEPVAQGNIGWACYRLGDSEKALELFIAAEKRASELQDFVDEGVWLTNAGYVYMDAHDLPLAESSFRRALALEQTVNSRENIYNNLRVLARLALQSNDPNKAGMTMPSRH